MSGEVERGSKPRWGWIAFGIGLALCVAAGAAAGVLLGQGSDGDGEALRRATALALDTDRLNDDALALSAAIEDAIAREGLEGEAAALRAKLASLELRSERIRARARSQLATDRTARPVADRAPGEAKAKHSVREIDATLSVFERQLVPELEAVLSERPDAEAPGVGPGSPTAVLAGVTRALEDQDETLEEVTTDLIEAHQDAETSVGGTLLGAGDPTDSAGCRQVEEPEPRSVSLEAPEPAVRPGEDLTAVVETSCGSFEIALDSMRAPETVNSFVFLAEQGFYDGLTFHRVAPGFVIQAGDPLGDGTGGPGYSVDERPPADLSYVEGTVAMAKSSSEPPGRSGSQFFVVLEADAGLPPEYALLGEVSEGMDVVRRIGRLGTPGERPRRTVLIDEVAVEQG